MIGYDWQKENGDTCLPDRIIYNGQLYSKEDLAYMDAESFDKIMTYGEVSENPSGKYEVSIDSCSKIQITSQNWRFIIENFIKDTS